MRNGAMLKLVTITTTSFSSKTPFVCDEWAYCREHHCFLQNLGQSLCIDHDVY
jgi:hypothetical protein